MEDDDEANVTTIAVGPTGNEPEAANAGSDAEPKSRKKLYMGITGVALLLLGIILAAALGTQSARRNKSSAETDGSTAGDNADTNIPTSAPSMIPPMILTTAAPTPTTTTTTTMSLSPTSNMTTSSSPTLDLFGLEGLVNPATLLQDPASPQYKAFTFLQQGGRDSFSEARLVQRFALATLYYATYAVENLYTSTPVANWTNDDLWLTSANECTWYGISCNDDGIVNGTLLKENNLTGSIPQEISLLSDSLELLDISLNTIFNVGDDGLAWMGALTNLRGLFLGFCFFDYDGIPPMLGSLTNLQELDISYTLFFGPMNAEIIFPNMTQLRYLEMGGNSYNQTIPAAIANLPQLDSLYIENSDLIGDLDVIGNMTQIYELWLDNNAMLTSSIPTTIGQLEFFSSISFTACGLTGPIPSEMGLLTNLLQVWLYDNELTGTIPTELNALTNLIYFQVETNALTGTMPDDFCLSSNLTVLSSDCVTGEVDCACCSCCQAPC